MSAETCERCLRDVTNEIPAMLCDRCADEGVKLLRSASRVLRSVHTKKADRERLIQRIDAWLNRQPEPR